MYHVPLLHLYEYARLGTFIKWSPSAFLVPIERRALSALRSLNFRRDALLDQSQKPESHPSFFPLPLTLPDTQHASRLQSVPSS